MTVIRTPASMGLAQTWSMGTPVPATMVMTGTTVTVSYLASNLLKLLSKDKRL